MNKKTILTAFVIAAAMCLSCFALAGCGEEENEQAQVVTTAQQNGSENGSGSEQENEQASGVLSDEDYSNMIAGGLSKEEISKALSWTTAFMGDSPADYEDDSAGSGISYDTFIARMNDGNHTDLMLSTVIFGTNLNDEGDIVMPLSKLNGVRALGNIPPYEANSSDANGLWYTDDQNLYITPGWGDGPVVNSMEITGAEYSGDEMKIHFNLDWNDPIMNEGESGPYTASLQKQSDGKYALTDIVKD